MHDENKTLEGGPLEGLKNAKFGNGRVGMGLGWGHGWDRGLGAWILVEIGMGRCLFESVPSF